MIRRLISIGVILLCVSGFGCVRDPIRSGEPDEADFVVRGDGFKVYRFYDGGHFHYVVVTKEGYVSSHAPDPSTAGSQRP